MDVWKKKRAIMRRYDVTAEMYDRRYAEEQAAKIEAALNRMKIRPSDCVLDVGCGTGLLFCYVAGKAEQIVGLDISKRSLFIAKDRAKSFHNIFLVLADADNMPLKEDIFDDVFAFTLIQNTPDPARTLNELMQVAKENAMFAITGLKKIFSRKAFHTLLRDAGMRIVALEDENTLKCHVAACTKYDH